MPLKFMLQWIAASKAGRSLVYLPGDDRLKYTHLVHREKKPRSGYFKGSLCVCMLFWMCVCVRENAFLQV
jgi:hypothetical protein